MANLKLLVTGSAGFIGHHLVMQLLSQGHTVDGIDNFDPFYEKHKKLENLDLIKRHPRSQQFRFRELDINQISKIPDGTSFDAIIHLAARPGVQPSIQHPLDVNNINVGGTLSVLEFCRSRGISTFIFGSSSSVYGDSTKGPCHEDLVADRPISPYAASKRAGELYCHTYAHLFGLKAVCLRFFTVYGPGQRPDLAIHKFARLISQQKPIPIFGTGQSLRDYTYVTDIVAGITAALTYAQNGKSGLFDIFNLGSDRPVLLLDLVRMIGEAMKKPVIIQYEESKPGDVGQTHADITKSKKLLEYSPKMSIETGIHDFAEWYLNRGISRQVA